ncbi:MAG: flagellar biosynthetic protein FliO [Desulfoarculaceae bacterium]|nr:flagellar biosynthetic protein FliO [Desulfoarculaceae bacterium]
MRLIPALIIFSLPATNVFAGTDSPFTLAAGFRLLWGLLIVFGVLLIVYALAKKKLSFLNAGSGKGAITVIETRHLMPRKSLCLFKVRNQEFLLALGNDRINLIAAIEPSPTAATGQTDHPDFAAAMADAAERSIGQR